MDLYKPHRIGKEAELAARRYLEDKGMVLVGANYYCYFGEIDLIMRDKEDIVFVEVRCRKNLAYGNASETVDRNKKRKLVKSAKHFLQKQRWTYKVNSRFDVIAIQPMDGKMQIEWFKNAFTVDNDW